MEDMGMSAQFVGQYSAMNDNGEALHDDAVILEVIQRNADHTIQITFRDPERTGKNGVTIYLDVNLLDLIAASLEQEALKP